MGPEQNDQGPTTDLTSQQSESPEQIKVSPDLIRAYASNLFKIFLLFAIVVGAYFLSTHFIGENPFLDMLGQLGVSFSLILKILAALAGFILVLVVFQTTALSTQSLVFKEGNFSFSYGGFFKVKKTVPVSDVVKVNYKEYFPFKTGELEVELSGTEEKHLKLPFITDVKETCERIQKFVTFRKSLKFSPEVEGTLDSKEANYD